MRKIILLLTLTLFVSGCGINVPEKTPVVPDNTEINEQKTDYRLMYEDILNDIYEFIKDTEAEPISIGGAEGIWEASQAMGDEATKKIGYVFKDLNGDDIPELLIGAFDKEEFAYTKNEIYAVYTLINNKPEVILEGRSRSAYSLKQDNSFFYQGSNGAAYSIMGIYYISKENKLECRDYYFTYPNDDDLLDIEVYHNNTGDWEKDASKKLDITLDDFWELEEDLAKETAAVEGTPFAELELS